MARRIVKKKKPKKEECTKVKTLSDWILLRELLEWIFYDCGLDDDVRICMEVVQRHCDKLIAEYGGSYKMDNMSRSEILLDRYNDNVIYN